jgi:hypothetical protein
MFSVAATYSAWKMLCIYSDEIVQDSHLLPFYLLSVGNPTQQHHLVAI